MTDPVKLLSDDDLREIEAMKPNSFWEFGGDLAGEYVPISVAQRDVLCQTVRALREKHAQLAEVSGEWARLLDRIRAWSKCADGYPLDEHINNIATQNTALREQLAHWQERTRERTTEVERLQAQLAQVTEERDTVKSDLKLARQSLVKMCDALEHQS